MATSLIVITSHFRVTLLITLIFLASFFCLSNARAQETEDKTPASKTSQSESQAAENATEKADEKPAQEAEEKDPFAVPADANVKELFAFIDSVKRLRGRTTQSVTKAARAAVAGTEAIRKLEGVEMEDEIRAIHEAMSALSFLERADPKSRGKLKSLLEEMEKDERPEILRIAAVESFKVRIAPAREASKEDQQEMVSELKSFIADREFDREAYGLASGLARSIGYSDNSDVAASLYEDMAKWMNESKDVSLQGRAAKMLGAARRMRLPGNYMEVMGQTSDGKEFDWDVYRGKVVLVDFWASWCGPCRREVPNMKRNLEAYGERGFEIVGVNLDNTLAACEKYVEQEELTWANLMSDKDGERGWDNPLASHYGISAIPTAILVDQEGQVVSLRARGSELDRLLAEMLGEPEVSEEKTDVKVAEKSEKSDS